MVRFSSRRLSDGTDTRYHLCVGYHMAMHAVPVVSIPDRTVNRVAGPLETLVDSRYYNSSIVRF